MTAQTVHPRPGHCRDRARLERSRGDRRPAGPPGRRVATGRRGGSPGQSGARRPLDEPGDAARPATADGAARRSRPPWSRRSSGRARDSPTSTPIASATAAPPGFVNLRLADRTLESIVATILAEPDRWGRSTVWGEPRVVNVEFVSANPTGPLHVGNARGAFVGDLLCRVLEAGGQRVTREYYFNDSGGQISVLGASVAALKRGEAVPEDGYKGDYVADLAAALPDDVWAAATTPGADTADVVGRWAAGQVREGIERSLSALGVHFDVWTSEARLHEEGWVGPCGRAPARARSRLRARRRPVVPLDRLRRRQGSRGHPLQRRADVLRRRHRLRDREVQPWLRPPHLHLGLGSPRHGRPRPQCRRGDGLRP